MNSEIRDAGQEGTKEPNIVLYKINDSHEYKEIARFRGERITNGGGIVTNRGFKLTGLAHHHEIFRNVDITGVYIKEDGLHIYVTNSMVPVSAPVLPQHELLPSIHSEGSWGCRCGITVSFAHDRESAIESFNEHMAAAPVPERTNERTECDLRRGDIQCPVLLPNGDGYWSCVFIAKHSGDHKTYSGREWAAPVPQMTKPEQEPDEVAEKPDDYIHCAACGQPFNDGGGLYCSARCEEIGNPGAD